MIAIVVITIGIIGSYQVLSGGQRLANMTNDRVQAINYAREGIEATKNIRDSNYLQYPANPSDCWLSSDYECSGAVYSTGSYVLGRMDFPNKCTNCWYLSGVNLSAPEPLVVSDSAWSTYYKTQYALHLDDKGFSATGSSSSSACIGGTSTGCATKYTREIALTSVTPDSLAVSSRVHWKDTGGNILTVELPITLHNWRTKF